MYHRAIADAKTVNVLRNGKKVTINMPEKHESSHNAQERS